MENIWHYVKTGSKLVSDVYQRKVTHVVQHKAKASPNYCYWNGELDNDKYFMIQVFNAVVMLTISDREGELKTNIPVPVAYADGIKDVIDERDDLYYVQKLIIAQSKFFPKFMENLTFEEIMGIFMWEYASPAVEVYEHLLT